MVNPCLPVGRSYELRVAGNVFSTDTKYNIYPFCTRSYPVDYFSIDVMILVFTAKTLPGLENAEDEKERKGY
jgi:hypothetical protein